MWFNRLSIDTVSRKFLLPAIASLIAVVLTVSLLELSATLLFPRLLGASFDRAALQQRFQQRLASLTQNLTDSDTPQLLYRFHPYVGYVGRPGMRPWHPPYPPFNDHGMLSVPGHPYPYRRQPGDLVIAVLGGSVAEGFANLGGEAALQAYLDEHRPELGRRVVLISLATGGFKQPQQLFHLQTALLSGFQLDAVINLDGLNELVAVKNNLDRGIHPVYPSSVHTGLMAEAYQGSDMDAQTAERIATSYRLRRREQQLLELTSASPLRYSRFANLLAGVWSQRTQNRLELLLAEATDAAQNAMARDFQGPDFPSPDDPYRHAAELWADSSRLIQAVADAFDLAYLHVLQPNQYVQDSKPMGPEERKIAYQPDSEIATIVRAGYHHLQALGAELRKQGIAFHDLTRVFAEHPEPLYLDACCHFVNEGNGILARAVGEHLLVLLEKP